MLIKNHSTFDVEVGDEGACSVCQALQPSSAVHPETKLAYQAWEGDKAGVSGLGTTGYQAWERDKAGVSSLGRRQGRGIRPGKETRSGVSGLGRRQGRGIRPGNETRLGYQAWERDKAGYQAWWGSPPLAVVTVYIDLRNYWPARLRNY